MGRASRERKYMSALIASITNFKELAKCTAKQQWDEVLDEFRQGMKTSCRPYDKLGRYTVSDFLLFFPGFGAVTALEKVASGIISSIGEKADICEKYKDGPVPLHRVSELDPGQVSKNNTVDSNLLNDLILDSSSRRLKWQSTGDENGNKQN